MPALSQITLPPPQDYKEFEQIVLEYFKENYDIDMFGRSGQKQQGLDLLGEEIGIQCKLYIKKDLTTKVIDREIRNIEEFNNTNKPIKTFYFITTAERDVKIQKYIRNLNKSFEVKIVYWEKIQNFVKENENLLKVYYPNFASDKDSTFLEDFFSLTSKHNLYEMLFETDYANSFQEKNIDYAEVICLEIISLINSSKMVGVSKDVVRMVEKFHAKLDLFSEIILYKYHSNNKIAVLNDINDMETKEKLLKLRIELCKLYEAIKQRAYT